jgi:hypothetical protein
VSGDGTSGVAAAAVLPIAARTARTTKQESGRDRNRRAPHYRGNPMPRLTPQRFLLAVCTSVALLPGCYAPDPGDPIDPADTVDDPADPGTADDPDDPGAPEPAADGPTCAELEDVCEVNGDCCDFDAVAAIGTALCVDDGSRAACTDVCSSAADCGSGCCGQLAMESGYGACMDPSVCDAGYAFGSVDTCVRGVQNFCDCGARVDVPCEDQALFEDSCRDDPTAAVNELFLCFVGFGTDQCSAAIDACG